MLGHTPEDKDEDAVDIFLAPEGSLGGLQAQELGQAQPGNASQAQETAARNAVTE
jgi:hypothetical protein